MLRSRKVIIHPDMSMMLYRTLRRASAMIMTAAALGGYTSVAVAQASKPKTRTPVPPAAQADTDADDNLWPITTPSPLPGAILPAKRIVAFYGNPLSKRMGILGELPPDDMLARLDS